MFEYFGVPKDTSGRRRIRSAADAAVHELHGSPMAIDDLPGPVVNLLNAIGVPWPYINEDTVTQFATLTRQFGDAIDNTHQDATQAVNKIAEWHESASTERMQSGWLSTISHHANELVTGCQVLSDALDVAAGYIVAQKAEAIATLIGMAATFVADQAASVLTLGLAEAAVPLIIAAAEKVVKSLVMDLQQHIVGQVIEAAAKPLFAKVEAATTALNWSAAGGGSSGSPAKGFTLDASSAQTQTTALRQYAETMRSHGQAFQDGVRGLSF